MRLAGGNLQLFAQLELSTSIALYLSLIPPLPL
jgi:hypothetical protein